MDLLHRYPRHPWLPIVLLSCLAPTAFGAAGLPADRPTPQAAAARVDAALVRNPPPSARLPAASNDEAFLRRASLDLTGKLPDPDALRKFVEDPSSDKRARLIDDLLASEAYAVNWGRYWRD